MKEIDQNTLNQIRINGSPHVIDKFENGIEKLWITLDPNTMSYILIRRSYSNNQRQFNHIIFDDSIMEDSHTISKIVTLAKQKIEQEKCWVLKIDNMAPRFSVLQNCQYPHE